MEETEAYSEILELAIAREVAAYHFYMALAERVEDAEMCEVLKEFAQEELEHRDRLELEVLKNSHVRPVDEEQLKTAHSEYVVFNNDSLLEMDYKDILLLAIDKEEASFRTYVGLVPHVHNKQSRETLLAIAEEEVKHKYRFEIEYDQLMKEK